MEASASPSASRSTPIANTSITTSTQTGSSSADALFQSIYAGDVTTTLSLVSVHLSAFYWQSPEETPLTLAVSLDMTPMTLALLTLVAETRDAVDAASIVDRPNLRKWTPLMIAAKNGNADIVKALVSLGADVNAHSKRDSSRNNNDHNNNHAHFSPLLHAAIAGHSDVAHFLLRRPEVDFALRYHDSTFQDFRHPEEEEEEEEDEEEKAESETLNASSSERGNILVHSSSSPFDIFSPSPSCHSSSSSSSSAPKRGLTILHCIAKHATPRRRRAAAEIGAAILSKAPLEVIDARAANGQTALHLACRENYASYVRALVRAGADVNRLDEVGRTPISYAFRHPYDAESETGDAVEEGEDEEEESEEPPVGERRVDTVVLRRRDGRESPRMGEEDGKAPEGCLEEILTRKDVQVNVSDRYSFSPMHIATMFGDFNAVKLLRSHGANLLVKDHQRNLPLHYAARDQMLQILDFLLQAEPSSVNITNLRYGQNTALLTLLVHSPPAIHRRRISVLADCVKVLLHHGANANVVNAIKKTPLDIAVKLRHWDCVRLLLLAGSPFRFEDLRQGLMDSAGGMKKNEEDEAEEEEEDSVESLTRDWRWCRRFVLKEPLSLAMQTRIRVRSCVGSQLWRLKLNQLSELDFLPEYVKNYILMREELT